MTEKFDRATIDELENAIGTEGLGRAVSAFVDELASLKSFFEALDDSFDFEETTRHAHTLKSISGTFGATALQNEAMAMEQSSRDQITGHVEARRDHLVAMIDEALSHFTSNSTS